MVWGRWDHFCDIRFLSVTLGQVVHVTPQTPKRRVDRAVLGACQRCSPLTQTYAKSAGMVWDHLYHIQFLSIHMKLAPAATSGALFCGELVGARKDAWHSNSRYCWFRARSQSLPSLGAVGGMVLNLQARQSKTFSCVFCNFHFCCAMSHSHWRL